MFMSHVHHLMPYRDSVTHGLSLKSFCYIFCALQCDIVLQNCDPVMVVTCWYQVPAQVPGLSFTVVTGLWCSRNRETETNYQKNSGFMLATIRPAAELSRGQQPW